MSGIFTHSGVHIHSCFVGWRYNWVFTAFYNGYDCISGMSSNYSFSHAVLKQLAQYLGGGKHMAVTLCCQTHVGERGTKEC